MFIIARLFSLKHLPFILCGCFLLITGFSALLFREIPFVSAKAFMATQGMMAERVLKIDEAVLPDNLIKITGTKNLQSPEFPVGFGIEIKNISEKSIYFLTLAVLLPESKKYTPDGISMGFHLTYGEPRLSRYDSIAQPGDSSIAPGESATLSINEEQARHFFDLFGSNKKEVQENGAKRVMIFFQRASFGDGTGYQLKDRLPATRIQSSLDSATNSSCQYDHCYNWLLQERVQCGESPSCLVDIPSSNVGAPTCKELCAFSITCFYNGEPYSCAHNWLYTCSDVRCEQF